MCSVFVAILNGTSRLHFFIIKKKIFLVYYTFIFILALIVAELSEFKCVIFGTFKNSYSIKKKSSPPPARNSG
jgi:hypothetical protein